MQATEGAAEALLIVVGGDAALIGVVAELAEAGLSGDVDAVVEVVGVEPHRG